MAQSTTRTGIGPGTETGAERSAGPDETTRDFRTRQRGSVRRWKSDPGAYGDLGNRVSSGFFLDTHFRSIGRARSTQRAAESQLHSRALLSRFSLAAFAWVGTRGMGQQRCQTTRINAANHST